MSEKKNSYDWAAYYAAAYEKERKQNTVLAGRIADALRRQTEYSDTLQRILSNPFWKLTAPARWLYHAAPWRRTENTAGACKDGAAGKESPAWNACLLQYTQEVERQKHRYREWINNTCDDNGGAEPVAVRGWLEKEISDTDVIIVAYGCGELDPRTEDKIKSCFNHEETPMLFYADEDYLVGDPARRTAPWFKPAYSPDTLLAFNYWGHMIAVKRELLSEIDFTRSGEDGGEAAFYELCLQLEEAVLRRCGMDYRRAARAIHHIDAVLYHQTYAGSEEELTADLEAGRFLTGAGKAFLPVRQKALRRRGVAANFCCGQDPELYHIVYDTSISGRERCARAGSAEESTAPHRVVSVVIPSKDHPEVLETCLKSFRQKTEYRYYEWIVVDNGSNPENRDKIEALQEQYGFRYVYEPMPFNFSRMCNLGVQYARGDLILLLNDDIEILEGSWLTRMAGQAMQPHVGAVGARLWYAGTEQIQHTGITNLRIGPSHKLITFPDDRDYYYGRNRVTYDMIGVTGACLMVSREKYRQIGGMNEEMAVAYNDVDFCFKLIEAGYYNVLRNDAVLYHHESLSRGLDEQDAEKWERLLAEKEKLYAAHPDMRGQDPFYHKELVDNASDYRCNYKFAHEDHLRTVPVQMLDTADRRRIRRAGKGILRLTVDRAELQHKICGEEPDIVWIMGWSYVPGADNAVYERTVLLRRKDGSGCRAVPADWSREDVEAILPGECHIGLAGFSLRLLRADLEPGEYRIGMLCRDRTQGAGARSLIAWSEQTVVV